MSNKTPFEIRLQLLEMAKNYLDSMYFTQLDFAKQAFEQAVALNKANAEEWQKYAPTMHSIEDINKKAAELYSFVTKKD